MQFLSFDESYIDRLRRDDLATTDHFMCYFSELLTLKLRSRLRSVEAIEDVRQETMLKVLQGLKKHESFRQPERLAAYVNTVCNNVLLEHYRRSTARQSLEIGSDMDNIMAMRDLEADLSSREMVQQVQRILDTLPERDKTLLRAIFFEEKSHDDVAKEYGVDRGYLRALIHRAKASFRQAFVKKSGRDLNAYTD